MTLTPMIWRPFWKKCANMIQPFGRMWASLSSLRWVPVTPAQSSDLTLQQNQYTLHLIETLRRVSELQSDIANIPTILSGLESELRVKGGFQHLQRLHQMSYAYGATLVEIVRRKDFSGWCALYMMVGSLT